MLCSAKVVEPLRSSPLGLESGCALSKQQHLNKRPTPASPKKCPFPQGFDPGPAPQQPHHGAGLCPHNFPSCLLGCLALMATLQPGRVLLPTTHSSVPHGFCLPFQIIAGFSPKKTRSQLCTQVGILPGKTSLQCLCRCLVLAGRASVGSHACHGKLSLLKHPCKIPSSLGQKKKAENHI